MAGILQLPIIFANLPSTPQPASSTLDASFNAVKAVVDLTATNVKTITASTTLDDTYGTVLVDTTGGAVVVTLPLSVNFKGKVYKLIHYAGTNASSIAASGSDTIVGPTAFTNGRTESIADGSIKWYGVASPPTSLTPAANTVPVRDASGNIGGGPGLIGEASAKSATGLVDLDMGTVTSGDRILVVGSAESNWSVPPDYINGYIIKQSGVTIVMLNDKTTLKWPIVRGVSSSYYYGTVSTVVEVTGSGNLVLRVAVESLNGTVTTNNTQIYAFFLKKQ